MLFHAKATLSWGQLYTYRSVIDIRERELELKLRKATADRGGLCLKFTSTNWAGAPDRLVVLPGGAMGFVEVKAPGQSARPLQVRRHAQLAELGCYVAVLDDPDGVDAVLDEIEQRTSDTTRRSQTAVKRAATTERSHSGMMAKNGSDDDAKPG